MQYRLYNDKWKNRSIAHVKEAPTTGMLVPINRASVPFWTGTDGKNISLIVSELEKIISLYFFVSLRHVPQEMPCYLKHVHFTKTKLP